MFSCLNKQWNHTIFGLFLTHAANETKESIVAAMNHFSNLTCVRFRRKTANDTDYLFFIYQPGWDIICVIEMLIVYRAYRLTSWGIYFRTYADLICARPIYSALLPHRKYGTNSHLLFNYTLVHFSEIAWKHCYSQLHLKCFDHNPSQAPLLVYGFMALYIIGLRVFWVELNRPLIYRPLK